jgi:BrnA antitoxin of type II toxin-antitoxin system
MRKEYDFSKAKLVVPRRDPRKTRITIRLDTEILKWFWQRVDEAGGGNYQTMINEALKGYIESEDSKTIRYPGMPHVELDERYQREYEDKGLEFQGRGYYVGKKIRDLSFTGKKAA